MMGIALIDDPVAEFLLCQPLDQPSLDHMKSIGVPVLALVSGLNGMGHCIREDRVETRDGRFEFARYVDHEMVRGALVALAFDRDGHAADIVAWRTGSEPFVASWLGQIGLLGEENLDGARLGEPLVVHPDPMAWLRSGREGVVVVDAIRAGPMLRQAGEMVGGSHAERNRLNAIMRVDLPKIIVRSAIRVEAAE